MISSNQRCTTIRVQCSQRQSHITSSYPSRKAFKSGIKDGNSPSFGLFLNSSSPQIAEQLAADAGYEWLLLDSQHSPVSTNLMHFMLTSLAVHKCPSLVRVGGPDDRIQQALDLGAYGIMIPTVRTPEDAQKAVQAAFFPPLGSRSIAFPISPQLGRPVAEFLESANEEILLLVQIETKESLDNLEEIINTPGVDGVFIGPFDLSYALGLFDKYGFPGGLSSEELREASKRIAQVCKKAKVAAGSFAAGVDGAAVLLAEGFTLLAAGTDVGLLGGAAKAEATLLKGLRK